MKSNNGDQTTLTILLFTYGTTRQVLSAIAKGLETIEIRGYDLTAPGTVNTSIFQYKKKMN